MKIKLIEQELEIPSNLKINPKATEEEIKDVWRVMKRNENKITDDGTINIHNRLLLMNMGLKCIPFYFNEVKGNFYCFSNKLTSLEGCPEEVGRNFACSDNQLYTLKYCPKVVKGGFDCRYNIVKFTKKYVRKHCKVGGGVIL